jgi:uncharacterized protein (TIRG00374 family)
MKRKLLIGSILSGLFLYLALRNVQWAALLQAIQRTQLLPLIPSALFIMLGHYARAYRWKFMMRPVKAIGTNRLFVATVIGLMANNVLPARLGEVVRAHILGRKEKISRAASFAAIVYERIVDIFALLFLLWIMLLRLSGPEWLRASGIWLLLLNALLFVAILIVVRHRDGFLSLIMRLMAPLKSSLRARILETATSFINGLAAAGKASMLLPIVLTSVLVWGLAIVGTYFCIEAIGLDVPFAASLSLVVIVSMGTMIPSAPAYIGTMQYACIISLALYQVEKSDALAFSLLFHVVNFLPVTVTGLFFFWKMQLRLQELAENR